MEQKKVLFNLSEELEFTTNGGFSKTATLEMAAPSMSCFAATSDFQQLVMRSFMATATSQAVANTEEGADAFENPGAAEIKIILVSSPAVKFSDIAESFKTLAVEVVTLDGSTKIKKDHFQKISIDDFVGMICEYVATFIFPSLFAEL